MQGKCYTSINAIMYHDFYKEQNGDTNAVHEYDSFTESNSERDEWNEQT